MKINVNTQRMMGLMGVSPLSNIASILGINSWISGRGYQYLEISMRCKLTDVPTFTVSSCWSCQSFWARMNVFFYPKKNGEKRQFRSYNIKLWVLFIFLENIENNWKRTPKNCWSIRNHSLIAWVLLPFHQMPYSRCRGQRNHDPDTSAWCKRCCRLWVVFFGF